MSPFLVSRRRLILRHGAPMTLRRQTGVNPSAFLDVPVAGVLNTYRPEQIVGGVKQGDANVAILHDEIAAAAWPGPPRAGDALVIEKTWQLIGAMAVRDGALIIGWYLWIRGGG